MATKRMTRVNELLKREIVDILYRRIHEEDMDMAAVTVTEVITSPDLRHARVLVSIREHQGERNAYLGILNRNHKIFQRELNRATKLKYTPQLAFELDPSIERGDRVLRIIAEMERERGQEAEEESDEAHDEI